MFPAESARMLANPAAFGSTPFFGRDRIETLKPILAEVLANAGQNRGRALRIEREYTQRVLLISNTYVPYGMTTWHVPGVYEDQEASKAVTDKITSDARHGVGLALRWFLLDDATALSSALGVLDAWSRVSFVNNTDSALSWCTNWPMFLQLAMMLRQQPGYTPALHARLVDVTTRGLALSVAFTQSNNWAQWGVALEISSAVFLRDRARFDRAVRRWRSAFDEAVIGNIPVQEIYRQGGVQGDGRTGIWYSNFTVLAMTVAAEWARTSGVWLYDYANAGTGSSFRGFVEQVRHWTRYPEQYPYNSSGTPSETIRTLMHDYPLFALWPDAEGAWLLDNKNNITNRDAFGMTQYVLNYCDRPLY